ncbi:SusC/RagA family TonB-linked outer membrane protein [Bacteroides sp. OttesenSCG-928-N06]|nr:SusC/RagA family TonB-linked outer membrane protein [Bacteroides sp. OttesenSCG-928-N06]
MRHYLLSSPTIGRWFRNVIVLTLLLFSASLVTAQAQNVTIRFTDKTVEQVLEMLKSREGYSFVLKTKDVNLKEKVTGLFEAKPISEILDVVFANQKVSFEIKDKMIIITRKDTLADQTNQTQPQMRTISGTVIDGAYDEPIIGASIKIQGASTGTITNLDGEFQLDAPAGATITVSCIGYMAQNINIGSKSQFRIILAEDAQLLDEVVVVGYGVQNKKTLTGAISVVKFDDMETASYTSISHALAGKAAGMRVNMVSAQPGGATTIKIRGEAAGGAGSDPLVVIDGFPVGSTGGNMDSGSYTFGKMGSVDNILGSLNPDDIESISVLKDAASTAIYGARAGHGVILITTKRGANHKAKVSYSGQASVQVMANEFQILGVQEFMDMRNRQYYENYLANNGLGIYADYIKTNENPPEFVPHYTNDQILRAKETNWLDHVTRTGYMQQHNVQVTGGSNTSRYMLSLNYMNQEGIIKNNGTQRISGRFNFDQDFGKYVTAGITANYSQNKYDNVPLGSHSGEYSGIIAAAIRANPANPVYDDNGNYYIDPLRSYVPNPVSLLDYTDLSVNDRLMASGYITVKPIAGLEVKGQLGIDRRFNKRSSYIPKTTVEGQRNNGAAYINRSDASDYLLDVTATYTKDINDHKLKGLLGYAFQIYNSEGLNATSRDFITDAFLYHNLSAGAKDRQENGSSAGKRSIASYFGRVNYSYKDRYLLEATLRVDGSSNFTPDNRWGYFPSASAGWLFSEEAFMKGAASWLSNGKLRASYGATGNENVGYGLQNTYSINWRNSIIGGGENKGAYVSAMGNKDLTWETTTEFNIGLDLGFFNRRVQLTVEYFNRQVKDLLQGSKPIPSYNEVSSIVANAGKLQSQGYELTLNTINIAKKDMEWSTTLTLAHYKDRWKERPSFLTMKPYEKHNDPYKAWWAYEAVGIMQPGDEVPNAQKDLLPGMVVLKDQNNDGVIDDEDRVYQGSGSPKLTFGFNNTLRYKNFDLNVYFYGEFGNKTGTSYKENWTFMDTNQSVNVSVWANKSFSSTNLNGTHPTYLKSGTYGWGDFYVKDTYFIRCGSITLGYTIPVKRNILENVRIYANVNNPFVLTNWTGLDPETDNGTFPYPNIRSFGMGVNITF